MNVSRPRGVVDILQMVHIPLQEYRRLVQLEAYWWVDYRAWLATHPRGTRGASRHAHAQAFAQGR